MPTRVLRASVVCSWSLLALLACDQGLQPAPESGGCPASFVGACGTIVFRGAVPESTQLVYIVAYASFPQQLTDLLTFTPIPPPQLDLPGSPADTITTYQLPLARGRYEWILAVWRKMGTLTLENADTVLREAGFFRDSLNPDSAGVVHITGPIDSIDFVVDFDNMHPMSYWFSTPLRR